MEYKAIPKKDILLAIGGYVVMSCFYLYLARSYPLAQQLRSALGHSTFCFLMTFVAANMMNYFFNLTRSSKFCYFLVVGLSASVGVFLVTTLHLILGTPDLLITISGSALMGAPMFLLYPYRLVRAHRLA